jgi:excisionase family DNA binding protein
MSKENPKNESKIKSKIRELAEKQGITSSYGLMKRLNVAPTVAVNLWNDDVTRFSVETLQLLCEKLMCEVGELLVYEPNAKRSKPVAAPELSKPQSAPVSSAKDVHRRLKELSGGNVKTSDGSLVVSDNVASDNEKSFSTEEISEITGLKLSSVREHYNSGKLPFFKDGKKNRVRESDLNDFIARRGKK